MEKKDNSNSSVKHRNGQAEWLTDGRSSANDVQTFVYSDGC